MTRPAKSYTATRAVVVQASLNLSIGTRKGKYAMIKTNMKPQQLLKHTSQTSLVFYKFSYVTYRDSLN